MTLLGLALLYLLLSMLGCATSKGTGDAGTARIGLSTEVGRGAKAEIGDEAQGDLVKNNQILQVELENKAEEIHGLQQQISERDQWQMQAQGELKNVAQTIKELRQEAIGRDKWDLSGGGIWVFFVAGAALIVLLLIVCALISFIKQMAGAVYEGKASTIAANVKNRTQGHYGPVRLLGGKLGDVVIKLSGANAAKTWRMMNQ